jgi:hypothetical protein
MNQQLAKAEDNVYYNMTLHNIDDSPIPAYIYDQRSSCVLNDTTGYSCSIIRFSFPSSSIPLLIAPPLLNIAGNTAYSITLSFGASLYQEFVPYTSYVSGLANLYPELFVYFSYQQFCNDVNRAFLTAFNTLKLNNPACVSIEPPRIYYNAKTETFNIYLDRTYEDGFVNGIGIYFNNLMSNLFQTFPYQFLGFGNGGGADSRLTIVPSVLTSIDNAVPRLNVPLEIANIPTFLVLLDQQCSSIYNFNSILSIVLKSDRLPIVNEYLSNRSFNQNYNVGSNFSSIVTDFEPNFNQATDIRSVYTYLPTAEYRKISMMPGVRVDTVDMRFLMVDMNGNSYNLFLLPDQTCTIKILFTKN